MIHSWAVHRSIVSGTRRDPPETCISALLTMVAILVGVASAEPPTDADRRGDPPPARQPLPTLDELLGLEKGSSVRDAATPGQSDLERALRDEEPTDDFGRAVDLMDRVASRLEQDLDTGLPTQRMQEEAIRRLDKLIADARRQRQPQRQRQSQQPRPQDQSQSQPQPASSQTSSAQGRPGNDNQGQEMDPGDRRAGSLRQVAPGGSAAWGSLPEHIRSSLMQGFSDQFSSMYQSMTEAYYRRLAEDRGRDRRPATDDRQGGGTR